MNIPMAMKDRTCGRSHAPTHWLVDCWRRSAPAGERLVIRADEKTSVVGGAAASSCAGRGQAPVQLADPSSDAKSPTGPRCDSLSGLTIELMLVIWPWAISSATTAISRCCASR